MRYWSAFLALCLLLALAAGLRGLLLARGLAPLSQEAALRQATAVRIGYTVQKQKKFLTVSSPEELRELLDSISVVSTVKGTTYTWWQAQGTADFTLQDGSVLKTMFIYNNQLERNQWGHLYLKADFHEKVCALISRVEGKPIDVLKNNK
jgi:hypothetical protein